jgi:hypothetical protein
MTSAGSSVWMTDFDVLLMPPKKKRPGRFRPERFTTQEKRWTVNPLLRNLFRAHEEKHQSAADEQTEGLWFGNGRHVQENKISVEAEAIGT